MRRKTPGRFGVTNRVPDAEHAHSGQTTASMSAGNPGPSCRYDSGITALRMLYRPDYWCETWTWRPVDCQPGCPRSCSRRPAHFQPGSRRARPITSSAPASEGRVLLGIDPLRRSRAARTASMRETSLVLHWQGGDHSELKVPKPRNGGHRWTLDATTTDIISELARLMPVMSIAALLNRTGKRWEKIIPGQSRVCARSATITASRSIARASVQSAVS